MARYDGLITGKQLKLPPSTPRYADLAEQFLELWGGRQPQPVREFRFCDGRKWRFDLAWPEQRVAVELHGGVYSQGRHTRGSGFSRDREKMRAAALDGWIVLEYCTHDLASVDVVGEVERAITNHEKPQPV